MGGADDFVIPYGTAKAFEVDARQVMRLTQLDGGGQVADVLPFSRENPGERLWASKTFRDFGLHPTVGARLMSTGPWERVMMTITADTLTREPTSRGTYFHDVVGCCSRKTLIERYGPDYSRPGCFEGLATAVEPHGIPAYLIHDCFNAFMRTAFTPENWFLEPSDAREGDYIELRAEMDLLMAISACPGGSTRQGARGLRVQLG